MAGVEQGSVFLVCQKRDYMPLHKLKFRFIYLPEEVLSVGNTKFSDQSVERPKFLSLQ